MFSVERGGDVLLPVMEESLLELAVKDCGCHDLANAVRLFSNEWGVLHNG